MTHPAASMPKKTPILVRTAIAAALCATGLSAHAQISRGFIGPHEYALPVGFKPFNIVVQYATLQDTKDVWNANGDKIGGQDTSLFVGLTKYVHLWTPESHPSIGLAWEVIVPEVDVRDRVQRTSNSGLGDPITGFAAWFKPRDNWTLGTDFFLQVPVGNKDVGGGDRWNVIGSLIWDGQFGKVNYTGNLGYNLPGPANALPRPGALWHLNNRLGYRVSELVEPYVGLDYEHQYSRDAAPANHETGAALGVMFHLDPKSSVALHYEKGIEGENRPVSNNLNLRFVYVW